jgi:transcriptional/translational regulatory protein YebC/TACO1
VLTFNSETLTDNKTRAVAKVKGAIMPAGGSLAKVLYMFHKKGILLMKTENQSIDDVLEQAIEHGAEDVQEEDDAQFKVLGNYLSLWLISLGNCGA